MTDTYRAALASYLATVFPTAWMPSEGINLAHVPAEALEGTDFFEKDVFMPAHFARNFPGFSKKGLPVTPLLASALRDPAAFWAKIKKAGEKPVFFGIMPHHFQNNATLHFLEGWKEESSGKILEIGAGICELAWIIAEATRRCVIATDVHSSPWEFTFKRGSVYYIQADATELPFQESAFSGAVANLTLTYVRERGLKELFRVLQPGGVLKVVCHYAGSDMTNWAVRLGEAAALLLALNEMREDYQKSILSAQILQLMYSTQAGFFDGHQVLNRRGEWMHRIEEAGKGRLNEEDKIGLTLEAMAGVQLLWAIEKSPSQIASVFVNAGFANVVTSDLTYTTLDGKSKSSLLGITARKPV